jgi:4-hydroxybenzoate polyprenyltransferase
MNLLKFTRYVDWWEYKLPPLLAVAYATVIYYGYSLEKAIMRICFLLLAVIVGAIYVSIINDITDVKEDLKAGKGNSMAKLPILMRSAIVGVIVAIALYFTYMLYPDQKSIFFYTLAYLVFSLYSIRPFRFKERGLLGVACDAMGAHLFPALLLTAHLIHFMKVESDMLWYVAIGCWSFLYGVRGILWHQFYDRNNDLKSGTKTFATGIDPSKFRAAEIIIFGLELTGFLIFVSYFYNETLVWAALMYVTLVILRMLAFRKKIRIILTLPSESYQLLVNEFYIVFFPIVLLIQIGSTQPFTWIVLALHIAIFPMNTLFALKDFILGIKAMLNKTI